MSPRFHSIFIAVLTLAACGPQRQTQVDPFGNNEGTGSIARTLTCEAKDSAGNCLKKTCKQDAEGDCETYAGYCIGAGEHWSGTKEGGTCTKVL